MELFTRGSSVRLRSCHDRYLTADQDERAVRQSRDGQSKQSIWTVEMVPRKPDAIRLKSCYGKYLTSSETPFLVGMTGERVIQTVPFRQAEYESNWEPIREGSLVKLMSWNYKLLRANGGTPPWKNSVTHDHEPYTSATKKWILWSVEVVGNPQTTPFADCSSSFGSSFSAVSGSGPPASIQRKNWHAMDESAMEFFRNAKAVRLRSVHDKYLVAEDDEETVTQGRNGSSRNARWVVETVPGSRNVIRLKSCHGMYLTASNERFLLGATGRKVVQSRTNRSGGLTAATEWETVREGSKVKLKSRNGGGYLRANGGGIPPWRYSVTHDSPSRTVSLDWVVWEVDVLEFTEGFHERRDTN